MARRFLALDFREYNGDPVKEARFFGVLPLCRGEAPGLRRERYLWGEVLVLSRDGRKQFFRFAHYTPSSQAAKNALLRYAFCQVLKNKGYRLKGRIGEVLVFHGPEGNMVFLAVKWGGYTPAGCAAGLCLGVFLCLPGRGEVLVYSGEGEALREVFEGQPGSRGHSGGASRRGRRSE